MYSVNWNNNCTRVKLCTRFYVVHTLPLNTRWDQTFSLFHSPLFALHILVHFLNSMNLSLTNALVIISAIFSLVSTYCTSIIFFLAVFFYKMFFDFYVFPCFEFSYELIMLITHWLFTCRIFLSLKSRIIPLIFIRSCAVEVAATYFASVVDSAIHVCFLECQDTGLPEKNIAQPLTFFCQFYQQPSQHLKILLWSCS